MTTRIAARGYRRVALVAGLLLLAGVGCGSVAAPRADAGKVDTGAPDVSAPDVPATVIDAGTDVGIGDDGVVTPPPDGSPPDRPPPDGSPPDRGPPDVPPGAAVWDSPTAIWDQGIWN